ncbi:hypothetical protein GALMADRAFT_206127 [Galerina marginata CBS 339.88]|uniref:Uncharacterized protein n=1 Tax=Galerina marginata (strain CBS 339.88) TaxID=685588 RepID=A0A067TQH0_GALM3|nr:hypothetical protein GALMADRAFT_206127 [Galerina marginata CBS 339.88]
MPGLSPNEAFFLGTVLEGYIYGIYCVVFSRYFEFKRLSKEKYDQKYEKYAIATLFTMSTLYFVLDLIANFCLVGVLVCLKVIEVVGIFTYKDLTKDPFVLGNLSAALENTTRTLPVYLGSSSIQ